VKPKLHIHKECGQRFLPLLHISYTMDCLTALLGEDVSSGYYVLLGKQSCCPEYTYKLANAEGSTKGEQMSYLGDVPQE